MTKPRLSIHSLITLVINSKTASSTGIMTVGMGLRLFLQVLSFIIVSRFVGASEFGAFASVATLVAIIGAFSGWGAELLIIKNVARSPWSLARAWGSGLVFLGLSAPLCILVAFLIVPLFVSTSISRGLIFYVVIADIVFARINMINAACYQGLNRPMGNAWLYAGFSGFRLAAALLWVGVAGSHDARSWAAYYCGAAAMYAVGSLPLVVRDLGMPEWNVAWHDWRDGFHFSLLSASAMTYNNIGTPVVALLSNLPTAGVFAAASRIAEAAVIPFYAFMFSALGRFFQFGATGAHEGLKFAVRILPVGLAIALIGSVFVMLMAPVAPILLGHSYTGTSKIIMLLAALPVIYALYYIAADVLIGSQNAGLRSLLQCLAPFVNIISCGLLVPSYGAFGAAVAALLSHTIMAGVAWVLVVIVSSRARRGEVSKVEL